MSDCKYPELYKALAEAQKEMPAIPMDKTVKVITKSGGTYYFDYATLPNILSLVRPVLSKHGLSIVQMINGKNLITRLCHSSGEAIGSETELCFTKFHPDAQHPYTEEMNSQEKGSVITYFRRYAIVCLLGIAADEDEDANTAVGNTIEKQEKKPLAPSSNSATDELLAPPASATDALLAPAKPEPKAPPKKPEKKVDKPDERSAIDIIRSKIDGANKSGYGKMMKSFLDVSLGPLGFNKALEDLSEGEKLQLIASMNKQKWESDEAMEAKKKAKEAEAGKVKP